MGQVGPGGQAAEGEAPAQRHPVVERRGLGHRLEPARELGDGEEGPGEEEEGDEPEAVEGGEAGVVVLGGGEGGDGGGEGHAR